MECVRSTHYLHQSLHTRDDAAAECTQHGIAKASIQVQRAVQPVCLPGPIRPSTVPLTTTLQSTFLTNQKPYEISVNNQPMNAEVRVRARACHTRNTYLYLCRTKFPTTVREVTIPKTQRTTCIPTSFKPHFTQETSKSKTKHSFK